MAISSSGIISGLQVDDLITGLMAIEKKPLERVQAQQTTVSNKISALGQIKSAIASLQEAAKGLSASTSLYAYKSTVANASIASAATTSSAVSGSYSLEVEQLATSHKLMSSAGLDPSAGGTLTIQLGSTAGGSFAAKENTSPITVSIEAGSSLADVAKAINGADAGVTATVINGKDGPQLVVTSKESGENNQIKIESTIGGLGFDPTNPAAGGNMSQAVAAQNAILKIDGITIANTTSNTVKDAIPGVTLTLTKTNVGEPTELLISDDPSNVETKLKAFVDAYNSARDTMKKLSAYNASGTSGVLNGDSTVSSALNQLRGALSSVPAGVSDAFKNLSDFGVQTDSAGKLTLDSTKLQSALQTNFSAVTKSIAAYGASFETLTGKINGSDGVIESRLEGLNSTSNNLKDRAEAMNRMLTLVEARYRKQFVGLETLLGQMQTTSSYLTQQLSALSNLISS